MLNDKPGNTPSEVPRLALHCVHGSDTVGCHTVDGLQVVRSKIHKFIQEKGLGRIAYLLWGPYCDTEEVSSVFCKSL